VIRKEHRPPAMEFRLNWVVLFALLQGKSWGRKKEDLRAAQCACDSFLTRMSLCLQVYRVRRSWWSLEEAWCSLGGL